jgi:uncharacterized protein (TIGR02145 family)
VPTDYEWANLLDLVDGSSDFTTQTGTGWGGTNAGIKLKSASTYVGTDPGDGSWSDNANRGTDDYGFGAVPAGWRHLDGTQFYNRGLSAVYWSSSVGSSTHAWYRALDYNNAQVGRTLGYRSYGFSVRCVKD